MTMRSKNESREIVTGSMEMPMMAPNPQAMRNSPANEAGKMFLKLAGVNCVAKNDIFFSDVRQYFGIANDFAADTFEFKDLRKSSGKGGDPLTRTSDGKYFIKQLNKGDHAVLENSNFIEALCRHITNKDKPSVLGPIVAHFLNPDNGIHYIAMMNIFSEQGTYVKQYDLKGCADDRLIIQNGERLPVVRKRFYKLHMWLGITSKKRKEYKKGKLEALHEPLLPTTDEGKEHLVAAIQNDTAFLIKHGLMDYSLMAGILQFDDTPEIKDLLPDLPAYAGKPFVSKDGERTSVML